MNNVTVTHEPTKQVVFNCSTVREAEAFIAGVDRCSQKEVSEGAYEIDAPDEMVQQPTAAETYPEQFARAKRLATKLLKVNDIKPTTKRAHEAIYCVFYGVFNGDLPAGVSILLLAGRATDLINKD